MFIYLYTVQPVSILLAHPCLYYYYYLLHLHLNLGILQTLLSKATYNWGIHKAINLEEANRQRKCPQHQVSGIVKINTS